MTKRNGNHRNRIMIFLSYGMLVGSLMLTGCAGIQRVSSPERAMDCSVYKTIKTKDTLKFQFGYMQISTGADLGMDREEAINWNSAMHKILARYLEACSGYNAKMLTKNEYEQKIQRITLLSDEARETEQGIINGVRERHETDIEKLRNSEKH